MGFGPSTPNFDDALFPCFILDHPLCPRVSCPAFIFNDALTCTAWTVGSSGCSAVGGLLREIEVKWLSTLPDPLAPGSWESVFISQPPELSLVFSFLVLALEYIYFLSHTFGLPAQNPRFRSPLMEPPNTPAPRATHISMRLPDTHVLVALPFWRLHALVLRFSRLLRFGLSSGLR